MCRGYLLLLITMVCFHPFPVLFKCCHCVLLKYAKRPEHGGRTKSRFSHRKKCHKPAGLHGSFHSTDWHLQRWNLNFMSGKDLISGTTKPFAPWLWVYEHFYSYSIQLSSIWQRQWNKLKHLFAINVTILLFEETLQMKLNISVSSMRQLFRI